MPIIPHTFEEIAVWYNWHFGTKFLLPTCFFEVSSQIQYGDNILRQVGYTTNCIMLYAYFSMHPITPCKTIIASYGVNHTRAITHIARHMNFRIDPSNIRHFQCENKFIHQNDVIIIDKSEF